MSQSTIFSIFTSLIGLNYIELDSKNQSILIPKNQNLSIEEVHNKIAAQSPILQNTICAAAYADGASPKKLAYCTIPLEKMEKVPIQDPVKVQLSKHGFYHANLGREVTKIHSGIDNYLKNRDKHLNLFSKCFDYSRGRDRALSYQNLLMNCKSVYEVQLVIYSLLAHDEGKWLKKYVYESLGFKTLESARRYFKLPFLSFINSFPASTASQERNKINAQIGSVVAATNSGEISELPEICIPSQLKPKNC